MPYEVQTYTPDYGWANTWLYHEGDGVFRAETFETREAAKAALAEHLEDLEAEFRAGQIESYSPQFFSVTYVPDATSPDPATLSAPYEGETL